MKEDVKLKCFWCSNEFYLCAKEYDRQIRNRRSYFFCSRSCVAKKRNTDKTLPIINKICPICQKEFWCSISKKTNRTFCSRECASKGSVTDLRRESARKSGLENYNKSNNIGTIESIANSLRVREDWKYSLIKSFLNKSNIRYQFEFPCGSGIFDLALLDLKIFVEFDGPYHRNTTIKKIDDKKVIDAKNFGWNVVRIQSGQNTIIDPKTIYYLFENK
jgi:very-short-patch-repair endonuclease